MCGIAGLLATGAARPPAEHELTAMVHAIRHRGPDGLSTFLDGPVGLAHARLSIIDLESGWQPIHNEDRTVSVIANGEIFNYLELRQELQSCGHRFSTASDTEVIVHLYEEHGDAFVKYLNGQFAIALWDARSRRLILARDRCGIRPLFFTRVAGRLAFASEIKALFTLDGVERRLDIEGVAGIFSVWSALPPRTPFEGVSTLAPGHLMTIDDKGEHLSRYWDWNFPDAGAEPRRDERECAEELHALLVDAVRLQLRADVPVSAYLSGGLDSSVITAIIKNHTMTPLRAFSLAFEEDEFDESRWQRELVRFLGASHSSRLCTRASIAESFARTVWHAEMPVVRTAATPMMLLAESVRQSGFKVVLTGEGADEVFAGYDLFKEAKVRRFAARQPGSPRRGRLLERLYPYLRHSPAAGRAFTQRFFSEGASEADRPWFAHLTRIATTRRIFRYFDGEVKARLERSDPQRMLAAILPETISRWSPLARDQYVEAHTLLDGYLLAAQGDRMAMAASIETRYPFLDHRVIEFANKLPPNYKLRGLHEKHILKDAMRRELPESILERTKQPYRAPDSACFFADGKPVPMVAELLDARRLKSAGLFDPQAVGKLVEKCRSGRAIGFGDNMAFVGILSTVLLHDQFIRPAAFPGMPQ